MPLQENKKRKRSFEEPYTKRTATLRALLAHLCTRNSAHQQKEAAKMERDSFSGPFGRKKTKKRECATNHPSVTRPHKPKTLCYSVFMSWIRNNIGSKTKTTTTTKEPRKIHFRFAASCLHPFPPILAICNARKRVRLPTGRRPQALKCVSARPSHAYR